MPVYQEGIEETFNKMQQNLRDISFKVQSQDAVDVPVYVSLTNNRTVGGLPAADYEKTSSSSTQITLDRIYSDSSYLQINYNDSNKTVIVCMTATIYVSVYTSVQLLLETEDPNGARKVNYDPNGVGVTDDDLHKRIIVTNSASADFNAPVLGYFVYTNLTPGTWRFRPMVVADNKGSYINVDHVILSAEKF